MAKLKLIDRLVTKSYIGPYILFFFIVEFVLVMQFLWKYIDDILGKGFTMFDLLQMIFYYGVTIIPMAIPLTVLVSSVMVYGDMSEKYELVSMKSAGISLVRMLRAGMVIAFITAAFSLFASNYLKPVANYNFYKTFYSIKKKKSTLMIEEGIFNSEFNGYTIRVGKKFKDNTTISDVLLYDHSDAHKGIINVVSAKDGKMYNTQDGKYFVMELYNGEHVKEMVDKKRNSNQYSPLMRTQFKKWTKVFDLAEFNKTRGINIQRKKHELLNSKQMLMAIDSLDLQMAENESGIKHTFGQNFIKKSDKKSHIKKSKSEKKSKKSTEDFKKDIRNISNKKRKINKNKFKILLVDSLASPISFYSLIDSTQFRALTIAANSKGKSFKDKIEQVSRKNLNLKKSQDKYWLRVYQQYSWAFICIIFLFIGAPLGSIVKKGGFGFPVLIAISFFISFIILMIAGEKLLKAGSVEPFIAAWLPCLVLSPIAILVTFLALRDLKVYDIIPEFKSKKISSPEENIRLVEASEDLL